MHHAASILVVALALGLALAQVNGTAATVDRVAVDAGAGNHVDILDIGVGSSDWGHWPLGDGWSASAYGTGEVDLWEGRDQGTPYKQVTALGAYPVLRLEPSSAGQLSPYLEASVGVNLLSRTRINDSREFSTAFQFGEFLGAGAAFGEKHQYELGVRMQHVSNGNIKFPNDGLTYGSVVFQYRFSGH